MGLARQTASAESAIRQGHTALPLHIHWSLGLCTLGFGFVFLLLLCAGLLRVTVDFALLALLCTRLKTLDRRLPGPDIVVVFAFLFP